MFFLQKVVMKLLMKTDYRDVSEESEEKDFSTWAVTSFEAHKSPPFQNFYKDP